jgi:hypothetical protein
MSMHDSCQHTRPRGFRDRSHTLELRWCVTLIRSRSSNNHTKIHIRVCAHIYICFLFVSFSLDVFCGLSKLEREWYDDAADRVACASERVCISFVTRVLDARATGQLWRAD